MAIELIDKIKPKNNGSFKMVDSVDVEMADGKSLEESIAALFGDLSMTVDSEGLLSLKKGNTVLCTVNIPTSSYSPVTEETLTVKVTEAIIETNSSDNILTYTSGDKVVTDGILEL